MSESQSRSFDTAPGNLQGEEYGAMQFDLLLGSDRISEYWTGQDLALGIPVLIRLLKPELEGDQEAVSEFAAQARRAAQVNHPNIARVLRTGAISVAGQMRRATILEWLDGGDLRGALEGIRDAEERVRFAGAAIITLIGVLSLPELSEQHVPVMTPSVIRLSVDLQRMHLLGAGIPSLAVTLAGTEAKEAPKLSVTQSLRVLLRDLLKPEDIEAFSLSDELTAFLEPESDADISLDIFADNLRKTFGLPSPQGASDDDSPTNIRPGSTSFIGRAKDLEDVGDLLQREHRLVTLIGPGGMGKTRLATELGQSVRNRFSSGVWFCDLSSATSVDGICFSVSKGLGVSLTQSDALTQIHRVLRYRGPTLVVLDNFEQIVQYASETLGTWMKDTPHVSFLVTSREALHLEGESRYQLEPLSMDVRGSTPVSHAIQLFLDRIEAIKPGFALDASSRDAIETIVSRLDGIPLAIELAAAQIAAIPPQELSTRLSEQLDLLRAPTGDKPERQATLRSTIDWSWRLLKPWEQSALAQLSIFRGGFLLEAAEEVIDLSEYPDAPFEFDVVDELVSKSLLRSQPEELLHGELRFSMFESIREFATEKLEESGLLDATRLSHAEHYVSYLDTWQERIGECSQLEFFQRVELDLENLFTLAHNLEAISEEGKDADFDETRKSLVASSTLHFAPVLAGRGPWSERIPRLRYARGLLNEVPPSLLAIRVRIAQALVSACFEAGNKDDLKAAAEEAKRLCDAVPADNAMASELKIFGAQQHFLSLARFGQFAEGAALLDEVLNEHQVYVEETMNALKHTAPEDITDTARVGILSAYTTCLSSRGNIYLRNQEYEEAMEVFARAERIGRKLQLNALLARVIGSRGIAYANTERYQEALDCYAESEALNYEVGRISGVAHNLINRGNIYLHLGDYETALQCYMEGEALNRDIGNPSGMQMVLGCQANPLRKLKRYEESIARAEKAIAIGEEIGDRVLPTYWKVEKAETLLALNQNLEVAKSLINEVLEAREAMGMNRPVERFDIRAVLALVHHRLGELEVAQELAIQARAIGEAEEIPRLRPELNGHQEPNEYWRYIDEVLGE